MPVHARSPVPNRMAIVPPHRPPGAGYRSLSPDRQDQRTLKNVLSVLGHCRARNGRTLISSKFVTGQSVAAAMLLRPQEVYCQSCLKCVDGSAHDADQIHLFGRVGKAQQGVGPVAAVLQVVDPVRPSFRLSAPAKSALVEHVDILLVVHITPEHLGFRGADETESDVMHRHAVLVCRQPVIDTPLIGTAVEHRVIQADQRRRLTLIEVELDHA